MVASGGNRILYAGMMIVTVVDDVAGCGLKKCINSLNQIAVALGKTFMPFYLEQLHRLWKDRTST